MRDGMGFVELGCGIPFYLDSLECTQLCPEDIAVLVSSPVQTCLLWAQFNCMAASQFLSPFCNYYQQWQLLLLLTVPHQNL